MLCLQCENHLDVSSCVATLRLVAKGWGHWEPSPHGEVSAPLGIHLHLATKVKDWNGDYVDLLSLQFREPDPKPWMGCKRTNGKLDQFRPPKVERNWDNWVSGFTISLVVLL